MQTRCHDEHVAFVQGAVTRSNTLRVHGRDRLGDQRDVVASKRRVEVVADEYSLAPEAVVRRQLRSQRFVRDLALEVLA